jgi:hypothetical protein
LLLQQAFPKSSAAQQADNSSGFDLMTTGVLAKLSDRRSKISE